MTVAISLVVRWLGFHTSNAGGTVQPLVRGLRLHMLCGVAKTQEQLTEDKKL